MAGAGPGAKYDSSQVLPISVWGFTQGLMVNKPATEIPDNAISACSNWVGYEGRVRRRAGWSPSALATLPKIGTDTLIPIMLGEWVATSFDASVSVGPLLTKCALGIDPVDNVVYFFEWVIGTGWVRRINVDIHGYANIAPFQPQYCNFLGKLYFVTGGQGLISWEGPGENLALVTNANAALAPYDQPKFITAWDNRLFMAHCTDQSASGAPIPYRVAWSDFLTDNIWQGGNSSTVQGGSAGFQDLADSTDQVFGNYAITGMIDTRDYLLIFKNSCIYLGQRVSYAQGNYNFTKFNRGIGCVSQNTIKRFREMIFFLGDDNVYMIDGVNMPAPNPIGDPIRPRLISECNVADFVYATALMDPINQLYHLFLPSKATGLQTKVFTFSIRDNAWWEGDIANTNIQPLCGLEDRTDPFTYSLIAGSRGDSNFYVLDPSANSDSGTAFKTAMTTKTWDAARLFHFSMYPSDFETMQIQRLTVHANTGNPGAASFKVNAQVTYGPNIDDMDIEPEVFKFNLGAKSKKIDRKFQTVKAGDRFVNFTFSHPDLANAASLDGLTMHLMPRGNVI